MPQFIREGEQLNLTCGIESDISITDFGWNIPNDITFQVSSCIYCKKLHECILAIRIKMI